MTAIPKTSSRAARLLLIGCSSLALSVPSLANEVIFSSSPTPVQLGQRTSQSSGVTQIALTGGGTVSIVDAAEYTINPDGSINLYSGSITVSGCDSCDIVVRMPEGLEAQVAGEGSSASFSVAANGEATGHTLGGEVRVGQAGRGMRKFREGMMWSAEPGRAPRRSVANAAVAQPEPGKPADPEPPQVAAIGGDAGPVAAALNGIPVTLGDGLAAAGASSDIIDAGRRVEAAAANPSIETFPSGDFALLIAAAAQLEGAYGGRPFNAAQADVIRTYLRFLASGGAQADFLAAYSGFVLDYLDLIRAGGVPSGFASGVASAADIDAYLAFIGRTGAIADLAARDRALADAYLAFITSGGNRDLFAASFTDLTAAYFAFLRAGGVPTDFTGASQAALAQSIAFLRQSGLDQQLSAADRALITAFLENGGIAFASQFQTALDAYFAYLASGRLPSDYDALDQATLRAYLETLANTGLLDAVLADQAAFYSEYLAFLRAGGDVDAFAGLPANIFAGYAVQLDAYFAFLAAGNLPSQFTAADIAQLQSFILQLQAAGALDRFVGANQAAFFASFGQFVADGGAFDNFAGLNANIFAGYAVDLQAYFDFLSNGGIPSGYTVLSQETIAAYIAALEAAGATDRFLLDLTDFYQAYFQFVLAGGNPDNFAGLPVPPNFPAFADALNAYAAFLAANGLPSDYSDEDIARLQEFFAAVLQSGQVNSLLGANGDLLTAYFAFLEAGGQIDAFAGLPIYLDYVAALNAYAAFLSGGGLPSDYAALDLSILRAYLDALAALPGGLAGFDGLADNAALVSAYFAFVSAGGDIDGFTGLPIYADYIAALNAYFEFLANGGLPSEYTALDLAILEAYLAALAALQGGLAGFADLNNFFLDYYEFLLGGGDPDQFAGLPGNGGGGNPDIPPQLAGYSGGFDAVEPLIGFVLGGGFNGGLLSGGEGLGFKAGNLVLDENGGLQSYVRLPSTGGTRTKGSTEVVDIFGNADALIGRWTNGTISIPNTFTFNENQGLHYVLTRPVQPDFALPANGRIDYYQIAATRPTIADGSVAPGVFDAQMAILLGTEAKLGLEGTITMSTGADPYVFSFSTAGGIEDPSQSTNIIGLTTLGTFSAFVAATDNGGTCSSIDTCGLSLTAGFAGDINTVGLTYRAVREGFGQNLAGAAIFKSGPERTFNGNAPDVTLANQSIAFANKLIGDDVHTLSSVTYNSDGIPIGYVANIDPNEALTSGDMTLADTGTAGSGTLAWTRWTDGTPGGFWYNVTLESVGPNGGYHVIAGAPLTNLPTEGAVFYDLIGFTMPTRHDESTSTGSVAGGAAVVFGSSPVVALDLEITSGADVFDLFTTGRLTDPSQSTLAINPVDGMFHTLGRVGNFNGSTNAVFVETTSSFCASTCSGFVEGFLAGDGASHMGLSYSIRGNQIPNTFIDGTAAFAAGDAFDTGNTGGTTGTGNPIEAIVSTDHIITQSNRSPARNLSSASVGLGNVSYETDASGQIVAFRQTNTNLVEQIGTARQSDTGRTDSGAIRWTRWTDGTIDVLGTSTQQLTFTENQGYHILVGSPATDLPTTGRVDYSLVGGTSPTARGGGAAPGMLKSGAAAIEFGSQNKIGVELAFDFAGQTFNAQTAGGLANVGQSEITLTSGLSAFTGTGAFGNVTSSGDYCAATCQMIWSGFLAGQGGSELGLSYLMLPRNQADQRIIGTAAFSSVPANTSSLASSSISPTVVPIGGSDWSRWMGGPGVNPPAIGSIDANVTFDPVAELSRAVAGTDDRPATAAQRDWTIDQAERIMGGMITFGRGTPVER